MPLPNLPDDDLLAGGKENNKVIHEFGKPMKFDFPAKDHVTLCESLGLIDYGRAADVWQRRLGFIPVLALNLNGLC